MAWSGPLKHHDEVAFQSHLTAVEALRLWDEECGAEWPRDADPEAEVNGFSLGEIASSTSGWLSGVWGSTPLRRGRPRLDLETRDRLKTAIPDLDAAVATLGGDGRAYFIRLRDLVGWVVEQPRDVP